MQIQSASKGVSSANPKSGQLAAKLAAERRAGQGQGQGQGQQDERLMVSSGIWVQMSSGRAAATVTATAFAARRCVGRSVRESS